VFGRARTGNPPARLPAALSRPCTVGMFPALAPTRAPVSFAPLPVPVLPAVVPMDVDWAQTRVFPCTCFWCGAARHLTRVSATASGSAKQRVTR
jgi:hypothetical protein